MVCHQDVPLVRLHNVIEEYQEKQDSNETPNKVSVVRRHDISLLHLHDVIEERHDNVLKKVTTMSQTSLKRNAQ